MILSLSTHAAWCVTSPSPTLCCPTQQAFGSQQVPTKLRSQASGWRRRYLTAQLRLKRSPHRLLQGMPLAAHLPRHPSQTMESSRPGCVLELPHQHANIQTFDSHRILCLQLATALDWGPMTALPTHCLLVPARSHGILLFNILLNRCLLYLAAPGLQTCHRRCKLCQVQEAFAATIRDEFNRIIAAGDVSANEAAVLALQRVRDAHAGGVRAQA